MDKNGVLQALKGPDRFEVYFIRYGVLAKQGGRTGGCLGLAIFSRKGFPRDLPKLRTEIFGPAVTQFIREGRLLAEDKDGQIFFVADAFDTLAPYLESVLRGVTEHVAPEIEESEWRQVPEGILAELPVVGGGTAASIIKEIILKCGGAEISSRAKDVATLNEIIPSPIKETSAPQVRNPAPDEPTSGTAISLKDVVSILETVVTKSNDTQRSVSDLQAWATTALARARALEVQQKAVSKPPPALTSREVEFDVDRSGESSRDSRRSIIPVSLPSFLALILLLFVAAATAMYCYGPHGRGEPPTTTTTQTDTSTSWPITAEPAVSSRLLDVDKFLATMVAHHLRVLSLDRFLDNVADFLWENSTIQSEFGSKENLISHLKNNNPKRLTAIGEFIASNMKNGQNRNGVPYNAGHYWKEAIGTGGNGFRIHD